MPQQWVRTSCRCMDVVRRGSMPRSFCLPSHCCTLEAKRGLIVKNWQAVLYGFICPHQKYNLLVSHFRRTLNIWLRLLWQPLTVVGVAVSSQDESAWRMSVGPKRATLTVSKFTTRSCEHTQAHLLSIKPSLLTYRCKIQLTHSTPI